MSPIQIVLLPGLDGTGVLFRPLLNALPSNIQPIVVSYPPDKECGYDELFSLVLKKLPQGAPFVLLGESFSGPLSLRVAATCPPGLQGVILCASFISCPLPFLPPWAARLVTEIPFRAFPKFAQLKMLLAGYGTSELVALSKEALSLVQPKVLACRIREVIKVDVTSELGKCSVPVLYIQGSHDLVVPRANLKRILHIKPNIEVTILGAPHMVLQTQPIQAARAITRFATNLTAPSPALPHSPVPSAA